MGRQYLLFHLVLCCMCIQSSAQSNLSFEQLDSARKPKAWNIAQGKLTPLTFKSVFSSPFVATDGAYFAQLENDTVASPKKSGFITHVFAFSDTTKSISFDFFYLARFTYQRFACRVTLTRWNNNKRDTLSDTTVLFKPYVVNDTLLLQWKKQSMNLGASKSFSNDTAIISFTADAAEPVASSTLLFIDHIRLGKFSVGVKEMIVADVKMYPNPAMNEVYINALVKDVTLFNQLGAKVNITIHDDGENTRINISELPVGIYTAYITHRDGSVSYKRLIKK